MNTLFYFSFILKSLNEKSFDIERIIYPCRFLCYGTSYPPFKVKNASFAGEKIVFATTQNVSFGVMY
jgi:hypothetical protein